MVGIEHLGYTANKAKGLKYYKKNVSFLPLSNIMELWAPSSVKVVPIGLWYPHGSIYALFINGFNYSTFCI